MGCLIFLVGLTILHEDDHIEQDIGEEAGIREVDRTKLQAMPNPTLAWIKEELVQPYMSAIRIACQERRFFSTVRRRIVIRPPYSGG